MSGFSTHREVHEAPAGYRTWLYTTIPAAGQEVDIRDHNAWLNCPWLNTSAPGSHTMAQARAHAVIKALAVFLPDAENDMNFAVAEGLDQSAAGDELPDRGGLLHVVWPVGARRHSFYWRGVGADRTVAVEVWFDIPVAPPT